MKGRDMSLQGKIGFLGGGRMAEALIKGIVKSGLASADQIAVVDPEEARRKLLEETYSVLTSADQVILAECSVVILAVKPQVMAAVLENSSVWMNSDHLVISIAAGISLSFIEERLASGCRVVRVMPNTPALVLEGASALSPGSCATADDMLTARSVFSSIGMALVMNEKYLDAVTGLSGSGPAYVFQFIDALIDGAVKVGLAQDVARKLVLQTVLGSVKLAMESNQHPAQLKSMVTSPGGTTIAGLHELEKAGFKAGVMNAIEAATKRSEELGMLV